MARLRRFCLAIPCVLSACDGSQPEVGQVLHWPDPQTIREVLVSTSTHRLLAVRDDPNEAFKIVVARRGRNGVEHCLAGPGFARFLEAASSVLVVKTIGAVVETDTKDWVTVETWNAGTDPGWELRLRAPNQHDPRPVLQWGLHDQYVVEIDDEFWSGVASGCAELGLPGQAGETAP